MGLTLAGIPHHSGGVAAALESLTATAQTVPSEDASLVR